MWGISWAQKLSVTASCSQQKLDLSWQIPPDHTRANLLSLGLLPQSTEKDQLQYLLVAPMAVHRASRVDKAAALTDLPLDRIIGS
jgi:hypothetical protein